MTKKKEDVADIFFKNYDYTDEEANETSPGGGFYHGKMDKYKSVTDFRNKKRKKKAPKTKTCRSVSRDVESVL